ncbi:MAG: type I restriction-modification system subunit M N-terminal domain-containing protein [Clostridiales bacterium]|nr:type I restriction-modification system subunit M N-terminal domain-containing protein [Clostridiales bacterium]
MTDRELKTLKDNLWHAADVLRSGAHLAANKYGQPILGLIFLRYADILFKQHKAEIDAEFARLSGTRMEKTVKEIAIEKCGFFLPECAYYDFINDAPDTAEKADLVKKAMEAIEQENPKMQGVLPKEVYAQLVPEEEPELLATMDRYIAENGYENDLSNSRLHHEIYLSDARKVPPEKWKTVIRHPIRKA